MRRLPLVLLFFALLLAIDPLETQAGQVEPGLMEMEVLGVSADPRSGQPRLLLRTKDHGRHLTLFIGPFEATGILLPLQRMTPPRPYTHDLVVNLLTELQATLVRVVITELKDDTFFALVILAVGGREIHLDARPSDAIALALRTKSPIFAAEAAFPRSPTVKAQ
ncbi:MAG: bifunctional nuclease family protein [Candidatus Methylomirabilales bacterium]